jgi:hypothetical protein
MKKPSDQIGEFFIVLFQWLQMQSEKDEVKKFIDGSKERLISWWGVAKKLSLWLSIIIFLLIVIGIAIGYHSQSNTFMAILGIIIATILLILLSVWIPLAALIGAAIGTLRGITVNINELIKLPEKITDSSLKYAHSYLDLLLAVLMWELIVTFFLSVVPFWNNLRAMVMIILCSLLFALMTKKWGGKTWYKSVVYTVVTLMFVIEISACFFPNTVHAAYNRITNFDNPLSISVKEKTVIRDHFSWLQSDKILQLQKESHKFNGSPDEIFFPGFTFKKGDTIIAEAEFGPVDYELSENKYKTIYPGQPFEEVWPGGESPIFKSKGNLARITVYKKPL